MTTQDELIGIELIGGRARYKLTKLLGAGLTARVYIAEASFEGSHEISKVAIKVMRPGLGEEEKKRFRAEGEHLAGLLSYGAEAAPKYYELFKTDIPQAPEVLVLELMTGKPVQDIVQEEGKFKEIDGLILARQLAQLLEVLHGNMQQTYTDLKFENLWWHAEQKQLKVTDWNVLSSPGDLSRVPIDLLRASRYVYTVLTGGEVREKGGIVVTPFMQHPYWSNLSLATQHVLKRALHRNPERRYASATALKEAFEEALWFWEKDLRGIVRRIRALTGGEYDRRKYEEALRGLDVWRLRRDMGAENFALDDQDRLDDLLFHVEERLSKEKNKLERGIHLFRGNSFREASISFQEAQEDDPWDMNTWRWREAARAGLVTSEFQDITRDVEQAIDALSAGEYARAEQILHRLSIPALKGIEAEARTHRLLAEGEKLATEGQALVDAGKGNTPEAEELFRKAQQAFGDAADALAAIVPRDYREQVLEELGDIAALGRTLADERRTAAALSVAKMREAESFYQSQDWSSALESLTKGLEAVPGHAKLIEASSRYGKERLQAGDTDWAAAFFLLVMRSGDEDGTAKYLWRIAQSVNEVAGYLHEPMTWGLAVERCQGLLSMSIPLDVRAGVAKAIKMTLEEAFATATSAPNVSVLLQMVQCTRAIGALDYQLQEWTDSVNVRWPGWLNELLLLRLKARGIDNMATEAELALKSGDESAQVAQAIQPAIKQALEHIPATSDLAQAERLLRLAQRVVNLGGQGIDNDFSDTVRSYTQEYHSEVRHRRQAALETVEQFILGLTAIDDVHFYQKAKEALAEALLLTPKESETYPRLKTLEKRVVDRWEIMQRGADVRIQVENMLNAFPEALGKARSRDDFTALKGKLKSALDKASSLEDRQLIDAIGADLKQLDTAWSQRSKVQNLERELMQIHSKLMSPVGGGARRGSNARNKDALWRELRRIAEKILELHPNHSDAAQAIDDYNHYIDKVGPGERLRYLNEVEASLKPALDHMQWIKHYLSKGDFEQAQERLNLLPDDWRQLDEVKQLEAQIEAMRRWLTPFQSLMQAKGAPNAQFQQAFQELLHKQIPAEYWKLSGVVQWLSARKSKLMQRLLPEKATDKETVSAVLAELAAVDQYYRQAVEQSQGKTMAVAGARPNAKNFVELVLTAQAENKLTHEELEQYLENIPLASNPVELQSRVKQQAEIWLKKYWRFKKLFSLPVMLGVIGGLLLLVLLGGLAAYVWPGFNPASIPNIKKTATAYVQVPRETVITVPVTATPSPTSTYTPTPTSTPIPTNTPTPTSTATFTATPISYLQPERFSSVSSTLAEKPLRAPVDVTPAPAEWMTDTAHIVAVADDSDAESSLYRNGKRLDMQLKTDTAKGMFGGMNYIDATTPISVTGQITTTDLYAWPAIQNVKPGKYHLLIYIPNAHGTAPVMYAVRQTVDNPVPMWQEQPLLMQKVVQKNFGDEWIDIGEFDLSAGSPIQVVAFPVQPLTEEAAIAFDAIALVQSPPPINTPTPPPATTTSEPAPANTTTLPPADTPAPQPNGTPVPQPVNTPDS